MSLVLVAGMLGASTPALAAESTVANVAELKSAIEALPAGASTITLDPSFAPVGATPAISLPENVDLTLTGPGATISKEAGASGRHLDLVGNKSQTVTIVDLVFEGHNPADPDGEAGGVGGGGVGIREVDKVTVSKATFSGIDGSAGLALGGVTTLNVDNSSFMGNRAAAGAAIELPNGINATITDSTLHKNWGTQPGYSGGALRPQRMTNLTIERSVFSGNVSYTRGGAIAFHQMEGSLTVRDSVFSDNSVPLAASNTTLNDGGAIAVNEMPIEGPQSGKTLITGSTFSGNVAADEGGALLIQSGNGSEATIQNSTFYANRAEGKQQTYDDTSGGGAIEAFGTPLTLEHNTFVNNFAHKGTAFLGHQRGGAVSATGDTAFLKAQPLTLSHNLFVGNDVGFDDGSPAPSSAYRQVSARGGIETLLGEEDTVSAIDDSPGAPALTRDDLFKRYPDRKENPADGDESDFTPFAGDVHATNVGVDNGTSIDLAVVNRAAVLGDDNAKPAKNDSGVVAGDARTGTPQSPGTFVFHPADEGFLTGLADNIGDGSSTIEMDQRQLPVDNPADAGSLQQAFIRYDPNGGDWADYVDAPFDGKRVVQRDDAALVWMVGAIGSDSIAEPEPTTPPAGKTFVEWNTEADGSGTGYSTSSIAIPAGNLRLYAIWEDIPVEQGTVTAEYVDENGDPLRDPIVTTGD
ncbi:MAG: right-handed parallel beta-helix repeat-containing protein, partial [Leucobacter sp.]|nr:right-handed parallel beta-helix repeat-containing protein [Leucobacter sp.]